MACTAYALKGITNDCATSKGGIREVYIADWQKDLFTLSETSDTVASLKPDAKFYKFFIKKNTSSFTSTATIDLANGVNYVSTELNLIFTRMETSKRIEMSALLLNDVAVIVIDANGKAWCLGLNNPVNATAGTGESGTSATDGNKYSITLTDESDTFPFEYTGDLPTPSNA